MILFGASGHSKVVLDILISNGVHVNYIIDDQPKVVEIFGTPVYVNRDFDENQEAIIAIGNNKARKEISEKHSFQYISTIHKSAVVSKFSTIGAGTAIMANVTINPGSEIGKHCIINTAATIEHDCKVGDYAHISPNASLAGNVEVGEGAHIGIGASVIQDVRIGKWSVVGAGTVVIKDVPDFATVVGNPGKVIKINGDKYTNE